MEQLICFAKEESLQNERSSLQQYMLKGRIISLAERLSSHKMCCETWQCFLVPRITCEQNPLLYILCFSLREMLSCKPLLLFARGQEKIRMSFSMYSSLDSQKTRTASDCTTYAQSQLADLNLNCCA